MHEVTWGGSPHLLGKRDQIKMRDYMDRRVTPPKRVPSPNWRPPPPCKQALISLSELGYGPLEFNFRRFLATFDEVSQAD